METSRDDGYVHYLGCGDSFHDASMSKLINMCHLLYVNFNKTLCISKKFFVAKAGGCNS